MGNLISGLRPQPLVQEHIALITFLFLIIIIWTWKVAGASIQYIHNKLLKCKSPDISWHNNIGKAKFPRQRNILPK